MCWKVLVLSGPAGKSIRWGPAITSIPRQEPAWNSAAPGRSRCGAILYKQRYIPAEGVGEPQICFGNEADLEVFHLDDMENVEMKNFLPTDLAYDMNFHILSFAPGASHSFVETHIQEHGMYILEGEGVYLLDEDWRLIKKGDFVWFGPYCPQAAYAAGRTRYTYIYSKDCNRDAAI